MTLDQIERDLHDDPPDREIPIEKVGVKGLVIPIGPINAEVEIWIDLPKDKRGVHVSRIMQSLNEEVLKDREWSLLTWRHLIEFCQGVLSKIKERHGYNRGGIKLSGFLPMRQMGPLGKREIVSYPFKVELNEKAYVEVEIQGSTSCPHTYRGFSHSQRAKASIGIEGNPEEVKNIKISKMVSILQNSLSSASYSIVKREEEKRILEEMMKKRRFIEDVVREIICLGIQEFPGMRITARCVSQESIQPFDIYSKSSSDSLRDHIRC